MLTALDVERAAHFAGLEPHGIVVKRLDGTGVPIALGAGQNFYPASMIKTPLALAAFGDVADGRLALDERFACTRANMTLNDKPSPLHPGYRASLSELIDLMITRSDNVATNMLFDVVGRERATRAVQLRYGLRNTAFYRKLSGSDPMIVDPGWDGTHRNAHPAGDAARVFELIAFDAVPYSDTLRGALGRQEWNDKLSRGLRAGDIFYHKTGDTGEVTHDGGLLVTADGASYVVVVYTGLESNDGNNARFAPFMRAIRTLM
jgi:beta-lactamase class A